MKTVLTNLTLLALLTVNVSAQNQANTQPSTNRVLELNGKGSYVALLPNICNHLKIEFRR